MELWCRKRLKSSRKKIISTFQLQANAFHHLKPHIKEVGKPSNIGRGGNAYRLSQSDRVSKVYKIYCKSFNFFNFGDTRFKRFYINCNKTRKFQKHYKISKKLTIAMKGPNEAENTVTTRQPSFINCRGNRFLILNQLFVRESKYKETGKNNWKTCNE